MNSLVFVGIYRLSLTCPEELIPLLGEASPTCDKFATYEPYSSGCFFCVRDYAASLELQPSVPQSDRRQD